MLPEYLIEIILKRCTDPVLVFPLIIYYIAHSHSVDDYTQKSLLAYNIPVSLYMHVSKF